MDLKPITHKIGSREEWQAARDELLQREKEHTRLNDELAERRRQLPWVRVEKEYRFDTADGTRTLAEVFDGRSQLVVYHFMFGPSFDAGCPVCSSMADTVDGLLPHLHARDMTMLLVSRAARAAPGIQAEAGLEYSLGLLGRQRLQLRFRCLVHPGAGARAVGPCAGRPAAGPASAGGRNRNGRPRIRLGGGDTYRHGVRAR
jgi:Bacterial protein of unknown function (DUF899)